MMTLNFKSEVLIQIPKNHVKTDLGSTCQIQLTGDLNEAVVTVPASVQTLQNCYLLQVVNDGLASVGLNAKLEILSPEINGEVVYTAEAMLLIPLTPAPLPDHNPPVFTGDDTLQL